jgi:hypothetical protein
LPYEKIHSFGKNNNVEYGRWFGRIGCSIRNNSTIPKNALL